MDKKIEFQAVLDSAEFEKVITRLQQKVKEANMSPGGIAGAQQQNAQRMNQMGIGGGLSQPSMDAYNRAIQSSRRELDQIIKTEAQAQEKLAKSITDRSKELNKLKDSQKEMVKDSKAELDIREQIRRAEQNQFDLREQYIKKNQVLSDAMDARNKTTRSGMGGLVDSYRNGGMGGLAERLGTNRMGLVGGALGGISTALGFGAAAYDQLGRSAFRTQLNTGSAIEGTIGRSMQDMSNPFGQAWSAERLRSMQNAGGQDTITRRNDLLRSGAGVAGLGAAGVMAAGGPLGWIGSGISAAGGLGALFGNERMRALSTSGMLGATGAAVNGTQIGRASGVGNWLQSQGDQQMKQYNSVLAKEFADNFQNALQSEQQSNPLKRLAAQSYGDNFQGYLQSQRGLGLNYGSFHGAGGFRERSINAGFTDQQGMAMSGEILGAGGSTRAARDSVFALQLQRQGMTNAGQMMGSLSGSMGDSQAAQQALIKVLAEGTRLGFDNSAYAEENRKFSQTLTDIVSRTGARGGSDVNAVTGSFGRFAGDRTNQGIEAAKTAYEQYQQISSETTGPRGVMRAAGFMRDQNLSKISMIGKNALMQIREEDFNEQNPVVRAAAREAGLSVDDLRKRVQGVNENSQSRFKKADEARNSVRDYMSGNKIGQMNEEEYQKLPDKMKATLDSLSLYQTTELGDLGTKGNQSRLFGAVNQNTPLSDQTRQAQEDQTRQKYTGSETGREEDKTVANMAESGRLALDSFRQFHTEMIPTVDSIRKFNEAIAGAVTAMKNMSPNNQDSMARALSGALGIRGAEVQPQSGKSGQ
jgi:hypothetical protein